MHHTIIKLKGGLGNQLFQYALGLHYSKLHDSKLSFDNLSYTIPFNYKQPARKFVLDNFNVVGSNLRLDKTLNLRTRNSGVFKKITKSNIQYITEHREFSFQALPDPIHEIIYFDGYWQSFLYSQEIKFELRDHLRLKHGSPQFLGWKDDILKSTLPTVSVHVRRGDYVTNIKTLNYHGSCSLAYYESAFNLMRQKLNNPQFYLFTDDVIWARQHLQMDDVKFVSECAELSDIEEFELQRHCTHSIISNSTFSWWPAYLKHDGSIVITPREWLKSRCNVSELIPQNWIKIEN